MSPASGPVASRRRLRLAAPRMEALDPASADPIERQVYRVIRQTLISGAVSPGDKLSCRSLALALGVSAMPVREALKRLEADGVVESRAQSAFVVRGMTRSEYEEILQVRLRLEGLATRQAALRMTPGLITSLKRLSRTLPRAHDGVELLKHNYRMHFFLYQCAQMPYALGLIETIWLRMGPALNQVYGNLPVEADYPPHDAIIEALEAGDPDAAEAALRTDLLEAAEVIAPLLAGELSGGSGGPSASRHHPPRRSGSGQAHKLAT